MKKSILIIFSLLLISFAFAEVDGILSFNTFFTPNNFPSAPFYYDDASGRYLWESEDPETWNNLTDDWWMKRQDYWLQAYAKPSFMDFGFTAYTNKKDFRRETLRKEVVFNITI